MTRTYIIPMRLIPAQRAKHGKGFTYTPAEYRDATRELRSLILAEYGPFRTIEPAKRIEAAPTKGREARDPFRNVLIDIEVMLVGQSAADADNFAKICLDSFGPWSDRNLLKKDMELHAQWVPLYRNDRQVARCTTTVYDYQPYNELRFTVTELEAALEPGALHIIQGAHHNESNDEGDGHE